MINKTEKEWKDKSKCERGFTDLNIHLITQKEVSQFEIPVDDSVVVQILAPLNGLLHVIACLWLRHGLPPLVQLQE